MRRHAGAWGWAMAYALGSAAPSVVQAQASPSAGIYSCQDSQGRRITADRPIADCLDREQRVLGNTGVEKRRLAPSQSEEDRHNAERQKLREKQLQQQALEGARREKALLQRYPRKAVHDEARAIALARVDELLAATSTRMDALRAERGQHAQEMAFYRDDTTLAPSVLHYKIQVTEHAINQQLRQSQELQQERRRVQQRFDEELEILNRLWAPAVPASASEASGTSRRASD